MGCFEMKPNNFRQDDAGRNVNSKDLIAFKDKPIFDQYELELIPFYHGVRSEIKKAVHKLTGKVRAVRIVPKIKIDGEKLRNEISILRHLDHPNIVKIYEVFQDNENFYIVSELYNGKGLLTYLEDKGNVSEATATRIIRQVLLAFSYMHKHGIVHLNINPDNVIFENDQEDSKVKLLSFSSARIYRTDTPMSNYIGTCEYAAPEMIDNLYTDSVDIWSCGILLYVMLVGDVPFTGNNKKEIADAVKNKELDLTGPVWSRISSEVKILLNRMLDQDLSTRISVEEALKHSCFKDKLMEESFETESIEAFRARLKNYKIKSKVQNAIWVFMVNFVIQKDEKDRLLKVFHILDVDQDGSLSRDEIINGFKSFYKTTAPTFVDKIFKQIDQENTGSIDYSDFVAAVIDHKIVLSKTNLEIAFKLLDSDNSGGISIKELKDAFGAELALLDDTFWNNLLKEADKNGDNEIEFQEFVRIMVSCKGC